MQKRSRYQRGSIQLSKRSNGVHVWLYRYFDIDSAGGRVRRGVPIGTIQQYPTRSAAEKAAGYLRLKANDRDAPQSAVRTLSNVIDRFVAEEMSRRASTRRSYMVWLDNHIRPQWGAKQLEEIKPMAVRAWLRSLDLSDKSRSHVHGLLRQLYSAAMLWEWFPFGENPMALFKSQNPVAKKRKIILTVEQFGAVLRLIPIEPFRTMVLTAMCVGPRRSEFIALKWSDFDWERRTLYIRRGIVDGVVDACKTRYSEEPMPLDDAFAEVLQAWRLQTEFAGEDDWVFASPFAAGEMPYWPNSVNRRYLRAAGERLGFSGDKPEDRIGWHTLRHTYRSWLDDVGTPIGVMKDLMRHSDIRTTMNVYGRALPATMRTANSKVVEMAMRRTG
jgi:integrase